MSNNNNTSTHTVDGSKEEKLIRSRWSLNANGGGWKKGTRVQGDDKEEEKAVKARWSYNAGPAATKELAAFGYDDEEEDEEEEEDNMWKNSRRSPPDLEEASANEMEDETDRDSMENSFAEFSPSSPKKTLQLEEKVETPKFVPNPVVPQIPDFKESSKEEEVYPSPKRMHMELCGEICEREFRQMSLEAYSPSVSLRHRKMTSVLEQSLSASHHKRPSVRKAMRRHSIGRMTRKESLRNSLRELDF